MGGRRRKGGGFAQLKSKWKSPQLCERIKLTGYLEQMSVSCEVKCNKQRNQICANRCSRYQYDGTE